MKNPRLLIALLLIVAGVAGYQLSGGWNPAGSQIARLNSDDETRRREAADRLVQMGPDAVPALVTALEQEETQPVVLDILRQIGPAAAESVPAVSELATSGKSSTRLRAIKALGTIGSEDSGELLCSLLEDDDSVIRCNAVTALGKVGVVNDQVVPALAATLSDPAVRLRSLAAIGMIGAPAAGAVPQLIETIPLARDGPELTRVAWAIGQIGPAAAAAVPDLIELLDHENYLVRAQAAASLGSIGPASEPAVPLLITAVGDEAASSGDEETFGGDWAVARSAVKALGLIGPAAKEAIPTLTESLEHRDEDVREYSRISLEQIEPPPASAEPVEVESVDEQSD